MKEARGRRVTLAAAAAVAVLLGLAGYAARHRILEAWHLHRLGSDDPAVRLGAIEALGQIGSTRAVPALCLRLDSTLREERIAAASALGAIGPDAEAAAKPLVRLFLGEPIDRPAAFYSLPENALTDVARAARQALARIGPAAIPVILEPEISSPWPPAAVLLLLGFDEGLLPLADVARGGAIQIRARSCLTPRQGLEKEPYAAALEILVHVTADALTQKPPEVSRLVPFLNQWKAGGDAIAVSANLPPSLLSSDDGLARRLAAEADVRIAHELRSICLEALSRSQTAASAIPFLVDCFDNSETRSLAGDAMGQAGIAAVEPLLPRLLRGTGGTPFHAEFALIGVGTADLDAARAIVRALPRAEGEGLTRLLRVLDRIGEKAWRALDEALEGDDMALRRAARAAVLSVRRG